MNAPDLLTTPTVAAPVARVVLTTGTPFGTWAGLAAALVGSAPAGAELGSNALVAWCDSVLGDVDKRASQGAVTWLDAGSAVPASLPSESASLWGGVDMRLVWAIDAVDGAWPNAHWIIFVEPPAVALAARVTADAGADPMRLLPAWCAGAEALLKLLRRAPDRCVAIAADEGQAAPAAMSRLVGERLGMAFTTPALAAAKPLDPLTLAAIEGILAPDHRARSLHAELLAACAALADVPASPAAAVLARLRALDEAATRSARLGREVAELRREVEVQRQQAEQVHEELAYYHAELARVAKHPASTVRAPGGRVVPGAMQFDPPHRHLDVRAEEQRIGSAPAQPLDLRLVEHHGRPGLVVFGDAGRSPLAGWSESGEEDGRGYLLLVPGDRNAWPVIDRLGASDWCWLQAIVLQLEAELATRDDVERHGFWSVTAGRLRQQLDELPRRLRTDAVSATPNGGAVELATGAIAFDGRCVDGLRIRLASGPTVSLVGPEAAVAPLPSWPLQADGAPRPAWELPLGASAERVRGPARWDGTTAADRRLVVALLEALPAWVASPDAAAAVQSAGLGLREADLHALAREARASLPRPGLRQRVGALLRGRRSA